MNGIQFIWLRRIGPTNNEEDGDEKPVASGVNSSAFAYQLNSVLVT